MRCFSGVPNLDISLPHILKKADSRGLLSIDGQGKVDYILEDKRVMLINKHGYLVIPAKELELIAEELQGINENFYK